MSMIDNSPESVSSVLKVFGILQALGEQKEIGVTELSQRIMMSKSTVYRFLQTMKTLGYVSQEGETDKYALSLKLFELGAKALEHQDLVQIADEQMYRLGKQTKETLHLGMLDEDSIVYLHKIDSEYNLRMYSRIGRRRPLYSTGLGKVMMAWLPETEVRAMLAGVTFERFTEHTLADVDALLVELASLGAYVVVLRGKFTLAVSLDGRLFPMLCEALLMLAGLAFAVLSLARRLAFPQKSRE